MVVGASGSAYVLAKLADLIWNIIVTLVLLGVLYGIGSLIWQAV